MNCITNLHCCNCNKSLHISGEMNYVSSQAAKFGKLHASHQIICLRADGIWNGMDNGTQWDKSPLWWQAKFDSAAYQAFLNEEKRVQERRSLW